MTIYREDLFNEVLDHVKAHYANLPDALSEFFSLPKDDEDTPTMEELMTLEEDGSSIHRIFNMVDVSANMSGDTVANLALRATLLIAYTIQFSEHLEGCDNCREKLLHQADRDALVKEMIPEIRKMLGEDE